MENHKFFYEQVWDKNWKELLVNGSGIHVYQNKRHGEQIKEVIPDSL